MLPCSSCSPSGQWFLAHISRNVVRNAFSPVAFSLNCHTGRLTVGEQTWRRYFTAAAFLASVAGLVSIAVSHVCLGLSAALLFLRRDAIRIPPIAWPLLAFMTWTLASTAGSSDPSAAGPQLKKFFVFLMLPVVFSAFRTVDSSRRLAEAWFVAVSIAASLGVFQFIRSVVTIAASGEEFTTYYSARITGFFSHWETFSQAGLIVFVVLLSYLLFAKRRPGLRAWWGLAALILAVLVLMSQTRSVWLALVISGVYFVAVCRPRALLLVPVVLAAVYFLAPASIQQRVASMNISSNQNRIIMWRTGLRMIAAHPILGVGPEQVGPRFSEFQPPDVTELPDAYYGHLHNVYIHYAAERGIPATLIVLWLFAKIIWDLTHALRIRPRLRDDRRFLLHAGIAGTLAVMVVSCFDVSLGDSEVLGLYLGLVSIAYNGTDS